MHGEGEPIGETGPRKEDESTGANEKKKDSSLEVRGQDKDGSPEKSEGSGRDQIPPEVAEVVKMLPPDDRKKIQSFFASILSVKSFGPMPNPLFEKMNSEHVHEMLVHIAKESERDSDDRRSARKYGFWYYIIGLAAFFALVFLLLGKGQEGLLEKLVMGLVGFCGGYGLGRAKK